MTYGDTGWRNFRDLLINGWTTGNASYGPLMRRVGSHVEMRVGSLTRGTSDWFLPSQAGWRPPLQFGLTLAAGNGSATTAVMSVNYSDGIGSFTSPAQWTEVSWVTDDAWPTSLPGTAVGSIPQ